MPRLTLFHRCAIVVATGLSLCLLPGCSPSKDQAESDPDQKAKLAQQKANQPDSGDAQTGRQPGAAEEIAAPSGMAADTTGSSNTSTDKQVPASSANDNPTSTQSDTNRLRQKRLPEDLTPQQLLQYIEGADRDLQILNSARAPVDGVSQRRQAAMEIIGVKLQASRRVQAHEDASPEQKNSGVRGELQALSHLTGMRDVDAAQKLRQLAKKHLDSDQPLVAADSRVATIGFAINDLYAGVPQAADQIVELVNGIVSHPGTDVPAILIMARARELLTDYGHLDQAILVRAKILELFGDSNDPMIARIADEAAGTVKFDAVERMILDHQEGLPVNEDEWNAAVQELLSDSSDQITVGYLIGAALGFEFSGDNKLVDATFAQLKTSVPETLAQVRQQITAAEAASQARKKVIGSEMGFDDLPSAPGTSVDRADLQNKVVLMPFWSVAFGANALSVLPELLELKKQYPQQVTIAGMNLDTAEARLEEFYLQSRLDFPSFQSVSSADMQQPNPVAVRFGVVNMPFVAIFGKDGKTDSLHLNSTSVTKRVDALLNQTEESP